MRGEPGIKRWLVFNMVGVLGAVVQLTVLAALTHGAGMSYLPATALAVEAAVLHNFVWHQRWTWRDRQLTSSRRVFDRLVRFHLLNGSVSIAGNLIITAFLTAGFGLDAVAANVAAILTCSLINFVGSDALGFADAARSRRVLAFLLPTLLLTSLASSPLSAVNMVPELKAETLAAWSAYEQRVDARYARDTADRFFIEDQQTESSGWRQTARQGGVPMARLRSAAPGEPEPSVPDGRIHHWAGAVFVPGAKLDGVLARLQDRAGRESDAFDDVLQSRLLSRDGDRLRVFMKLRRSSIITVTYNTEHTVEYRRLGNARASSRSVATKIAELADAGTPREHERPAGTDNGILWRLNAYWRYEQLDGGVLIECESVSLSRSVPLLLRPIITGKVDGIARESLEKTLVSLRNSLTRK
jgi:putative flippase GtrA